MYFYSLSRSHQGCEENPVFVPERCSFGVFSKASLVNHWSLKSSCGRLPTFLESGISPRNHCSDLMKLQGRIQAITESENTHEQLFLVMIVWQLQIGSAFRTSKKSRYREKFAQNIMCGGCASAVSLLLSIGHRGKQFSYPSSSYLYLLWPRWSWTQPMSVAASRRSWRLHLIVFTLSTTFCWCKLLLTLLSGLIDLFKSPASLERLCFFNVAICDVENLSWAAKKLRHLRIFDKMTSFQCVQEFPVCFIHLWLDN